MINIYDKWGQQTGYRNITAVRNVFFMYNIIFTSAYDLDNVFSITMTFGIAVILPNICEIYLFASIFCHNRQRTN